MQHCVAHRREIDGVGIVLILKAKASVGRVGDSAFTDLGMLGRETESSVELQAGFGGEHLHDTAGFGLVGRGDPSGRAPKGVRSILMGAS